VGIRMKVMVSAITKDGVDAVVSVADLVVTGQMGNKFI
jgi:hypothetical protein